MPVCHHCGTEFDETGVGRPPRFCSSRCRVAAFRLKRSEQASRQESDQGKTDGRGEVEGLREVEGVAEGNGAHDH